MAHSLVVASTRGGSGKWDAAHENRLCRFLSLPHQVIHSLHCIFCIYGPQNLFCLIFSFVTLLLFTLLLFFI